MAASSRKGAEATVLTSSLVVLVVWGYRKLIEPAAGVASSPSSSAAVKRVIGLEPQPANAAQFAVAFGFTFFTLSVVAMGAPELAASMAVLIAVGDVLTNGTSVFTDINAQVAESVQVPAKPKGKAAK